jgi:hypothetical protein
MAMTKPKSSCTQPWSGARLGARASRPPAHGLPLTGTMRLQSANRPAHPDPLLSRATGEGNLSRSRSCAPDKAVSEPDSERAGQRRTGFQARSPNGCGHPFYGVAARFEIVSDGLPAFHAKNPSLSPRQRGESRGEGPKPLKHPGLAGRKRCQDIVRAIRCFQSIFWRAGRPRSQACRRSRHGRVSAKLQRRYLPVAGIAHRARACPQSPPWIAKMSCQMPSGHQKRPNSSRGLNTRAARRQ